MIQMFLRIGSTVVRGDVLPAVQPRRGLSNLRRSLRAAWCCAEGRASFCLRQTAVGHTAFVKLQSGHCAVVSNCHRDKLPSVF